MNEIEFRLFGKYALFTDPITKLGGEKCSYHVPTYEAIKGVLKSIYWKPTIIWVVDKVRVMKQIQTQTKGVKPLNWSKSAHDLSIYTFLCDVEYQVQAHFEWNLHRPEMEKDRIDGKHFNIARRVLEKGGRQDIFFGSRDCQAYVEPCRFGEGQGAYDEIQEITFGSMFHGFDYPDEIGKDEFWGRSWKATMKKGILNFPRPEEIPNDNRWFIKDMKKKTFTIGQNQLSVVEEESLL